MYHLVAGIVQMLGIKRHVAVQSTALFEAVADVIGIPYHSSGTPAVFASAGSNMIIFEKLVNLLEVSISRNFSKLFVWANRTSLREFFETTSSHFRSALLMLPFCELGGLTVKKELDQKWEILRHTEEADDVLHRA
ncbi:hypothetical protein L596_004502 [Steinernema carpocapsae]|uniref:Uncharacterized protein n=1 Tax=Steinernema carpocapsae TaxID=34508 RepID=A0A4U8UXI8_STECR|nr:hypothetical protein L596_004502 [Steinernema carpocapsae]